MFHNNTILVVDDEPNNLKLLQQILKHQYNLIFAIDGQRAIQAAICHRPDLILLDVMMPDLNGYEVCKRLKSEPLTKNIPVIFISAMGHVEDESQGFDAGGVDYILKPVSRPIVLRRVKTHLSLVHVTDLEGLVNAAIRMLGDAGHYNDTDTGAHIWRMANYASALSKALGWTDAQAKMMELAAPMHDTGKIGIPDAILKAPRKLDAQEWEVMKSHAQIGFDILSQSPNPVFSLAAEIALSHHERFDGNGYPHGLKGGDIPMSARIVAIADVFDALTMKRPYKEAWQVADAVDYIEDNAGGHFDPELVGLFRQIQPQLLEIKARWQ